MKKLIILTFVLFLLSACSSNKDIANITQTEENAKAAVANNVPSEYKQVTTNENGVKIYGKIVTAETASPTAKKVIQDNAFDDKDCAKEGLSVTYSEYYSDAYGGTVIVRTGDKGGEREIYNENGECFMSGDAKSKNYDLENSLAKYRLGNAMAEAIDRKVKKK